MGSIKQIAREILHKKKLEEFALYQDGTLIRNVLTGAVLPMTSYGEEFVMLEVVDEEENQTMLVCWSIDNCTKA